MDKNLAEDLIKRLKSKGADQCDVMFLKSQSISSSQRLGKLEKNEYSTSYEVGIRCIIGKKQSIISSSNLKKKNLLNLIDKVFDMTKIVPENNFCGLAESNQIYKLDRDDQKKLDLCDNKIPSLNNLKQSTKILEDSALENKKISNSEGAEISWGKSSILIAGSNGLFQEYEKTVSSYILAVLAENTYSMEREFDYKSKCYFSDLGNFERIGRNTAQRAVRKLNSKKVKTCKTNVIFDSRVSASLINNLASACNSSLISRGTSFLQKKLNKQLFKTNINIIDNPNLKKGLRSKIVDCEGIKCKKQNLIKNGVLNFYFNNLEYSKQLKLESSAHASRSPSSLPFPSPTNLYLQKGDSSKKQLIQSLKKGFLITELMGSSINMSNGDYSRGASGFWIENGEVTYPVSEVTIAGNLINIFQNMIPANDLEFNFSTNAPSCLVPNLTVAGI